MASLINFFPRKIFNKFTLNLPVSDEVEAVRPAKKAVKFKTGLVSERSVIDKYRGILVEQNEVGYFSIFNWLILTTKQILSD
jgi:hypothetical protein